MQLVLTIKGKELDRIEIKDDLYRDKDYLQSMQRLLIIKNELRLLVLQKPPSFYLEATSKMR